MALPFANPTLAAINAAISNALGETFRVRAFEPVGGGCVHRSFMVASGSRRYFVKINAASFSQAFEAEAEGLNALRDARVRAPEPIAHGLAQDEAWLVLEYVALREARAGDYIGLAAMLADLHETVGTRFGWASPNYVGANAQSNPWSDDWASFFRDARLSRQLEIAAQAGVSREVLALGERILDAVPAILSGHRPVPSLLHGDLWEGNVGFRNNGAPVMFDPAVYYGDRECDLAMTELFGGFPRVFYDTYFERSPVDEGYPVRRDLYNLYHLLNHASLFGGSYGALAQGVMRKLLAAAA